VNVDLMDILACPIDKNFPLDLHVFEKKDGEIEEGIIFCRKCGRVYPIIRKIPELLPDHLRNIDSDEAFFKKWKKQLNEKNIAWKIKYTKQKTIEFGGGGTSDTFVL